MRDTILNVVYDTETAELFGILESSEAPADDRWFREGLYRNRSGYWFLAGEGGSKSKYVVETPEGHRMGSKLIIPIGSSRALDWLITTGKIDAVRRHFGHEREYIHERYGLNL